jgi:lysophospholipase L1-like esterase
VLAYKPTVMTVMLGMNDGDYKPFDDATFQVFCDRYEHIVKFMKDAILGLRLTVIDPSPYDDVTRAPLFPGGYNEVLLKYGENLRSFAERNNLDFANTRLVKALESVNAKDPAMELTILPDRVHPGASGYLLLAASLPEAPGSYAHSDRRRDRRGGGEGERRCEHRGFRTGVKRLAELDAKG